MEVYLIRHTKVDVPQDICYGQFDVPLAPTFEQETAAIISKISPEIEAYFSSPSSRCTALVHRLTNNQVQVDPRLLELNFGTWENKKWNEIDQKHLTTWMNDFVNECPPEGESLVQLFERTKSFLDELRPQSYNSVAIVTHAGFMRCVYAYLLQVPLASIFKIVMNYGQIVHLKLGKDAQGDLLRHN